MTFRRQTFLTCCEMRKHSNLSILLQRYNADKKLWRVNAKYKIFMRRILIKSRYSVYLMICLYISIPCPSQSEPRLYNHSPTHFPVCLIPSCSVFCQKYNIFMACKTMGHMVSWIRFFGTLWTELLLPIKLGLPWENWNEWDLYICGSGGTAPCSPNLGTSWRQVLRFRPRVVYSSWKWFLGHIE
jgi:hypothetical protein